MRYVYGCHKSGTGNPYEQAWITEYLTADCKQHMICLHAFIHAYKHKQYDIIAPFMKPGVLS